jgi:hypothetical protein
MLRIMELTTSSNNAVKLEGILPLMEVGHKLELIKVMTKMIVQMMKVMSMKMIVMRKRIASHSIAITFREQVMVVGLKTPKTGEIITHLAKTKIIDFSFNPNTNQVRTLITYQNFIDDSN